MKKNATIKKIYLAGPGVFYKNSAYYGKELQKICRQNGFEGVYPADDEAMAFIDRTLAEDPETRELAEIIYRMDVDKIHECDAVLADLVPFRGPEADPGTCWEMGYAKGRGMPVFAYCGDTRPYHEKVSQWSAVVTKTEDGRFWDKDGMMIDCLGEQANLMMTRSLTDRKVHSNILQALLAMQRYFDKPETGMGKLDDAAAVYHTPVA